MVLNLPVAAQNPKYTVPEYAFRGQHYHSVDYGFSVTIPLRLRACVADGANHGVKILLDHSARCGDDRGPHVNTYADYNMPGDADTPERRAQIDCPDPAARKVVMLKGWILSGRTAAGCRTYRNSEIIVDVFTFRKTDAPDPGGWIVIGATLTTTAGRYNRDMDEFRRIIRMIRIAPDRWVNESCDPSGGSERHYPLVQEISAEAYIPA
jgi:hypothetical protein